MVVLGGHNVNSKNMHFSVSEKWHEGSNIDGVCRYVQGAIGGNRSASDKSQGFFALSTISAPPECRYDASGINGSVWKYCSCDFPIDEKADFPKRASSKRKAFREIFGKLVRNIRILNVYSLTTA
jgi:hypothetical protein